jgi:preprotein translocase subunit SecF
MFDFVAHRKLFYLISAALILPGIVSLLLPGGLRPGIDFTSGVIMTMQFDQPVEQPALRDAFEALDHSEAIVQRSSGENTFVIRMRPLQQAPTGEGGVATGQSEREVIVADFTEKFGPLEILNLDQVSPLIAAELVRYAILAVAAASVAILLYLWWAFRGVAHPVRFGASSVLALIHEALVVLGIFSIIGRFLPIELDASFLVAVLTVIGFAVHDSIVVFDRIRENSVRHAGESFTTVVNHSLMQTVARSLNTGMTVILTLVVLLLFGGDTIRTFVLALLVGIVSGTYGSIFFASMILTSWELGELNWLWPFRNRGLRPARA